MLPEYMKLIYKQQLNDHQEMEESLEKEGKAYQIYYVKEMVSAYMRPRNFHIHSSCPDKKKIKNYWFVMYIYDTLPFIWD